ncbi:MAG: right-handed parallel beta-helix repeat-containing protein [Gemmatimonadota bacterium]
MPFHRSASHRALSCTPFRLACPAESNPSRRLPPLAALTLLTLVGSACSNPTGVGPRDPSRQAVTPFSTVSTTGVTYYVSPTGNDTYAGTTLAKPWRSIKKVNAKRFAPGDRILFEGGEIFNGSLKFIASDRGSAIAPIVISTYGSARATINSTAETGLSLYNTAGFEVRNLRLRGAGRTTNKGSGISIYNDLAGGIKLPYIRIDSVEAYGYGRYGVVIDSWNASSGFADVRVTYSSAHDNALGGFSTYAQLPYTHQNIYFGHLIASDNPGVAGLATNSGSGITLAGVAGGMIERSIATNNGALCDAAEGPVGIWTYDSDGVVIQQNESYDNRTNGPADGGGFDLDQNTRNSVVQYNYSHGNAGAGYLMAHAPDNTNHSGNTIRYNISENDGRRNSAAAIVVWGRTINSEIYNNSVYITPSSSGTPRAVHVHNATISTHDVQHLHIRNNAFYATGGLTVLIVSSGQLKGAVDLRFEGNTYYAGSVAPSFMWGASTYSGLTAWRSATGQELLGGTAVGLQGDPAFAAPGAGGTIGNADQLAALTAYRLTPISPLIDRGLNLRSLFGTSVGPVDYWSQALMAGAAYDVGAHEWR